MSITKPTINKLLSLLLVLSVVITGLIPTTAVYASEVNTPGSGKSTAVLSADGLIMDVTVPTNVLIYVDEYGEVTTPDYLPIINNSVAPVFVHSLSVTTENGWTLDPIATDYTNFKVNQKNYWLSFNGLDPSIGPIALATPINGSDSLNLVLSAGVAPQRTAINALNIGEILITLDWDAVEGGEQGNQGDSGGQGNQGDSGGNQEFGFSVEGATHVGYKTFALTLTVTEPDTYLFAAVPPNAPIPSPLSPPPASCLEYIYDAGVHELEIVFSYAANDMTEADIYIWRLNDYDHIGPVKVEVREAEGGGSSETENTGPNGEYIPEGYVLATDADFSGTQNGEFKYIGSDDYVVIPHVIKGVPVTFYNNMFAGTDVKGVASNNPNIVGMMSMFDGATSSTLELIYLDTSNVTDMRSMFKNNQATSLDLSNFDTSNVTLMLSMFNGSQATSLDLSSFNISQVTDMSEMFSESKATVLDLSSFDMSNFDGSNTQYSFTRMLWSCAATIGYARTQADADILNSVSGKPYDLTFYPQGYEPPETPETTEPEWVLAKDSDFNGFTDGEFTYKGTAEYVIIPDKIKYIPVTSYQNMFKGTAVKAVKSTNPNVTNMYGMFEDSTAESLDLSELNTSGVTNMANMFRNSKATTIDLSNFDTTKVTTMVNMFRGSYATTLDLSSFDLSNLGASTMKDMLTLAKATTGYARTEEDAAKLNNYNMSGISYFLTFLVK